MECFAERCRIIIQNRKHEGFCITIRKAPHITASEQLVDCGERAGRSLVRRAGWSALFTPLKNETKSGPSRSKKAWLASNAEGEQSKAHRKNDLGQTKSFSHKEALP